ncbi:DUF2851 family protein [Chryseobacterium sp. MP_3.2]|uniref:DUF2851 family protein n=1 Tax=Chryseobacterium sp. MP_3.2 TaxID=3071712 RepID=UPI002DFC8735|nr:hypothetical protein [Chryseobacterium sp. MP_3.2]
MNEKLLQYLWNFKIFSNFDFSDVDGNQLEIIDFGAWNFNSGPDFLLGKIKSKGFVLAGHIELHVRASDWIFHRHSSNPEFENLILHVVYQNDVEIEEFQLKNIPTLELKNYIDESLLWKYESLLQENQFIPCAKIFDVEKIPLQFWEESLLKKLDEKSIEIEEALRHNQNNYEAVLFHNLAYAFGLKVNAALFKQLAESFDFKIINKIRQNETQLEALFFGTTNWLENPKDEQMKIWKREFQFLQVKFSLTPQRTIPKFSRLRPPNFPTLRLSQLASLYHLHQNLFSKVMSAKDVNALHLIFQKVKASTYWDKHFNFGTVSSVEGEKFLTSQFIDLVLINAVLPLKYTFLKNSNENAVDEILNFYRQILPEKNTIIEGWKSLGAVAENSAESQAMLYHYKNYCLQKKCLNCGIGFKILQNKPN